MTRSTVVRIHLVASLVTTSLVASFLITTVSVEVVGDEAAIRAAKQAIVAGLALLVPAVAAAAVTGRRLAGRSRAAVVDRKRKRMRAIGATGVLVLVPCAITLDHLARNGDFNATFATVQGVELLAGTSNLSLLALNMRDGFALSGKQRARSRTTGSTNTA